MDAAAERDTAEAEARSQGSTVILLSLYLLLLAFFIMLTALSERELTRAEAAVGSVVKVFKRDVAEETLTKTTDGPTGFHRARDAFETTVRATFADTLPVARFESDNVGNALRAELPIENLFRPEAPALFGSAEDLLGKLAAILNRREPDIRFRLEVVLRSGPVLPTGDQLGEVLEVRRAAAMAQGLRGQGAAGRLISVGVQPGDPGQVQFTFYSEAVPGETVPAAAPAPEVPATDAAVATEPTNG